MNFDLLVLLGIAALNAFTAWTTWRTRSDVRIIEKATNSMKDELVKATDRAAHIAGKEEGRLEGEAIAAVLAKDQLSKE